MPGKSTRNTGCRPLPWIPYDQENPHGFLVHAPFAEETVFPGKMTLISGIY